MEGRELTEEEIKAMSPEQIAELQKKNCLFCHIISGKIPAKKVYEDEFCFAFLDINPAAKGHVLLVPKNHYVIMPQVPEAELRHLAIVIKKISKSALRTLQAQGTNIFIANGAVAGQRAPHFMIHIIPRMDGDGISCFELPEKTAQASDIAQIEKAFRLQTGFSAKTAPEIRIEPLVEKQPLLIQKEERTQVAPMQPLQKRFITSEKAKRFHIAKCPFADKIGEDSRIYLTQDEALRIRDPCECTGVRRTKTLQEISVDELEKMLS